MFLTLIKTLIALHGGLSPAGLYPADYGPNLKSGDEFDFIIVGAGSAGSVVANRLSKISQWNVLVLEAGGYPSDMSEIPSLCLSLQGTDEDWQYVTEPSKTCCLGLRNKTCRCPRGKGLGGSSLINYLAYTRATKFDHDRWANGGNVGWDYDSVVQYYKKLENAHIEHNSHYGIEGDLHLTRYTSNQPLRQVLQNAYVELGYDEYTEDKPVGFRDVLRTVHQGTRQSAGKAFLSTAKNRKNLYVAIKSHVSKILVDRDTMTAFGVEVKIGPQTLQIKARKEIILSAGSFNSPTILMNSGIGPEEHLQEVGVDVIKNLKVGENYQEHVSLPFLSVGIDQSAVTHVTPLQLGKELYQFFVNKQGELTQLGLLNFANYVNTNNDTNFANIQIFQTVFQQDDQYSLPEILHVMGIPDDVTKTLSDFNKNSPFLTFLLILLHPKSTGRVRLRNSDPLSSPIITPNYFSDEKDVDIKTLLESVKLIKRLIETDAFSPYNPKLIDLNITNCREFAPQSDDFWTCAIRNIGFPVYHPVGTCKMGPANDTWAVVDPQLKIHGINRLRVIDASVMPISPSTNTNAPTLMIGEKGADLIKKDWLNRHDEL